MKGYELFMVSLVLAVYWLQLSSENYEIGRVGDELFFLPATLLSFCCVFLRPFMCSFSTSLTTTVQNLPLLPWLPQPQPPPRLVVLKGQDGVSQLGGDLWDGENHGGFVANGL